jgi:gamma-glutamylcysteine synthetase
LNLLDTGHTNLAVACMDINKSSYDRDTDIPMMEKLAEKFENLPDTGEIKLVKGGIMSKEKEKFVCEEGHQNDVSSEFCEKCGKNIKGLTRHSVEAIAEFNNKLTLLKDMMK